MAFTAVDILYLSAVVGTGSDTTSDFEVYRHLRYFGKGGHFFKKLVFQQKFLLFAT